MENFYREEEQMELPPGFRFHPTDEELISHYLYKKVVNTGFAARAIGEADLNKSEPWDLPRKAKMGEKEWYFFCVRDRKYPTGLRTNRATESGYWKATGKDKEIYKGKALVGMKKTLVFYTGRAPKGEKTNWVMHEYRLEGKLSVHSLPKTAKNEWVICRVFQKSSGGKKILLPGMMRMGPTGSDLGGPTLPPLMDSSSYIAKTRPVTESAYVPCFSNPMYAQRNLEGMVDSSNNSLYGGSPNPADVLSRIPVSGSFYSAQTAPLSGNLHFPSSVAMPDHSFLGAILGNQGSNLRQSFKTENEMVSVSQETGLTTDINAEISSVISNLEIGRRQFHYQEAPSTSSAGPADLDNLWSY